MLESIRKAVVAFVLLHLACSSAFAAEKQFRLGIISEKPAEGKIEGYSPLADYVASRLTSFGITGGKVVVASDLNEMLEKIRNKEVDVVFESAFSTIKMKNKSGMIPQLLVWKKGAKRYRTLFFVRKESQIRKLSDLKGKIIVLQDPGSTSAFLIPIAELEHNGLTVVSLKEKKRADAVNVVLAEHEINQAFWVARKKADAGAFNDGDWKDLPVAVRGELRVIHKTKPVLRYIISFSPALPVDLRDAISAVLVQMDRNTEGQRILLGASRIKKIEMLSDADRRSLAYVRKLMKAIKPR